MTKYFIIDSSTFGNRLQERLGPTAFYSDCSTMNALSISDWAVSKIKNDNSVIILLNADAETNDTSDNILNTILWLRCKHGYLNPIVIYSIYSLEKLLQKPENYFIISPGCVFKEKEYVLSSIENIQKLKPIQNLKGIKPFLKPRVDTLISLYKHEMANYAGMALMLDIARQVHAEAYDTKILKGNQDNYKEFFSYRKGLPHSILSTYFDLDKLEITEQQKQGLKRNNTKKILLVDDLADKGWQPIISQMLYGNPKAKEIKSLNVETQGEEGQNKFDIEAIQKILENEIKLHKPHLILLDLRLNRENGKIHPSQLGGYKLLESLKKNPKYKGVPVIMFTASSNAETIKTLLQAGAEAVWTKPGIEEGLDFDEIIERYEQLLKLTDEVFIPNYKILNYMNDQEDENFKVELINYDEIRKLLFQKLEYIKYRAQLNNFNFDNFLPEPYRSADAIYIDANTLITGEGTMKFDQVISSVFKLCILTHKYDFKYLHDNKRRSICYPKVVIMNCVYDETIRIAKVSSCNKKSKRRNFEKWDLRFIRATLAQYIVKELFNAKFARTEFGQYFNNKGEPAFKLNDPKENAYADGYIMDEISNLVFTNKNFRSIYPPSTRVLFITGDSRLKEKIQRFNINDNLTVICRECLIYDINSIEF